MDKQYTIDEVAQYFKVHRSTISRLIRENRLKVVNVAATGSLRPKWRIHDSAIQQFVSEEYQKRTEK